MNSPTATARTRPPVNNRAEELRVKREAAQAERRAKSIALQACLLPFLVVAIAIAGVAMLGRPNLILGLINMAIVIYGATCTIRTWVNIARKQRGLIVQAVIGTLLNGGLLAAIGMAFAVAMSRGY
jgi:uncharacterized membrane protein